MEHFLVSTGVVTIAEIGDKTQLLALMLAARFRAPLPIILGILGATIANHGLASWAGVAAAELIPADILRWVLGASFLAMAAWALIPDKADEMPKGLNNAGAFLTTLVAFFLVEIGDKTQVATAALAAHFDSILIVTAGTTTGMMIADVPAVFMGNLAADKLPLRLIRGIAAGVFVILGVLALTGIDVGFG